MSAIRPSDQTPRAPADPAPTADIARRRARRREARRRTRLARLDLGLGVIAALVLLLATPGLAITAVLALVMLALCLLSVVLERRGRRRVQRLRRPNPTRHRRGANGARAGESFRPPL